ncbi:MAG: efflux RND transporter permease subunit, partial [Thermodesulfovibrionales bacterium]|nr:efflux RND transporter permease subunit [Thermodesulfovibrionales bacterium]
RIEMDPDRVAAYGLTIDEIVSLIPSENVNVSAGSLETQGTKFNVRVPAEFKDPEKIQKLKLASRNGMPIYLTDVANVRDTFKDRMSYSRLDGTESITVAVKKRVGANIVHIAGYVKAILEEFRKVAPATVKFELTLDQSEEIDQMVKDLENNILTGLLLVVCVMLFALGIRNAILVSMAIPFSMFLSFMVLKALGITLNNVVLFSLTLALGMLVDNAIVIVENIYRHLEQGVPRLKAAMGGTSEVAYPVIGSTVTTLVAFSPMLFWPGIMGEFMGYLPLTLIITLSSSLFVAMVINPALCSILMKTRDGVREARTEEEIRASKEAPVRIVGRVLPVYVATLRAVLKHRVVVVCTAFALLVLLIEGWLLVVGIEKPIEFFPDIAPGSAYINIQTPEGADLDYTDGILKQIEMRVNGISMESINDPETKREDLYRSSLALKPHTTKSGTAFSSTSDLEAVEHVYTKAVTVAGAGSAFDQNTPNHVAVQFVDFKERKESTRTFIDEIRYRMEDVPGGKITVEAQQEGPPTGAAINIEIAGDNYTVLGSIAKKIRQELEGQPHVQDVRDDFDEGTPTVRVKVDRQRAALFGLSTDTIGFALKTGYNGLDVSTFREGGEDYDITVQLSGPDRRMADILRELIIPAPDGRLVPLSTLAKVDYSGSIGSIRRIDNERVVTVKANVDETKIPGPVARAEAEKRLEKFQLPSGYKVRFTGEFEFQKESEEFLTKAFVVALFLIFLVLVTQFNSVIQPFLIMTPVILSLGGAFLGLSVLRLPFGIIMTGVGVISLAGVVVNNGIVLVDYINKLVARGHKVTEAVVLGGATRLRPVVLTAITTILGLLPMVTGVSYDFHAWEISWVSESSMWWQSMAIVVIFGLMVSTFLTLVVVPALYSLFDSWKRSASGWGGFIRKLYWAPFERITGEKVLGEKVLKD